LGYTNYVKYFLMPLIFIIFISCAKEDEESSKLVDTPKTRSYYMGFTPWLYEASLAAQDDVYDFINDNGDIVAHHFQQGIPWSLASSLGNYNTYPTNIRDEVSTRLNKTASGKLVYLAIDSLNSSRNALTDEWNVTGSNQARTSPWDTRSFDDPNVISSYTNFAIELITRFDPIYFNYAPEISDLMISSPAEFNKFKVFSQAVYNALKSTFPNLKLMVSIALKTPGGSEMLTATNGFDEIKNYADIVGISTYGYAFYSHGNKGDPLNLPSNWLSQITSIAPLKEYAIVETGWVAEDLSIPTASLNIFSNETKQDNYLKVMFEEANKINAKTILWFSSYDYDTLWANTLGSDDISKLWKDSGLIDENFVERKSVQTWKSELAKTIK
jgi:hypothetical protein